MEWYRNQYNIPLETFYKLNVTEDIAYLDFYRRHYWNEIRFGVREWGDISPEMIMPAFTVYRQFGGVLPAPNGYDIDNTYTVKIKHYKSDEEASKTPTDPLEENVVKQERYNYSQNTNDPWSPQTHVEKTSFAMSKDDFDQLIKNAENSSFWEEIETLKFDDTGE